MHAKRPQRGSLTNWLLAVFWIALLVMAGLNAPRLQSVMTKGGVTVPGSESDQVRSLKATAFPDGASQTIVLVFSSPNLSVTDPAYQRAADVIVERVKAVPGVTRIQSTWNGGGEQLIGRDGRSTFATVEVKASDTEMQGRVMPALNKAVAAAPEQLNVYLTGEAAVNYDLMDSILKDVAKAERYVVPIILVVLLVIFGSVVAALIPLGLGLVSIAVTMGLFYLYAVGHPVHDAATSLISMLGMGVGVDYALFMVTRFREELAEGLTPAAAARRTVRTSGNAIIFSGATVVVSVASLYLVNNPIIRSLGLSMALVVVVSVLAAVTLLPVLLALLGHRVNALRVPVFGSSKRGGTEGFWYQWAKKMMRRPWLFTMAALIPLLVVAYPTIRMETGSPGISLLPASTGARQGFHVLEAQFSAGTLSPIEVLVQVPQGTVADATNLPKLYGMVESIKQDPAVDAVVSHVSLQDGWSLDRYRDIYLTQPAKLSDLPKQLGGAADGLQQAAAGLQQIESQLKAIDSGLHADGLKAAAQGLAQISTEIVKAARGLRTAGEQSSSIDLKPVLDRGDIGLRLVAAGGGAQLERLMPSLVNLDRGATVAKLLVIPKQKSDSPETMALIRRLRTELPAMAPELKPLVGGASAIMLDMNDQMSWSLPRVILLVLLVTFLILLVLLRSILLPLKAVLLNALSVGAAYGTMVLVFQEGHLSGLMGFSPLGYLESPIVVILFAVLFGLSMDYEVFLLSRVKEAYDASGNNEESVAVGLAKTAGIITGAGTIMVLIFGVFASLGVLTIKEMGFGLAVAVFLDASLIRMILAPALMRLAGDWNWWAPAWLLRILPKIDMQH